MARKRVDDSVSVAFDAEAAIFDEVILEGELRIIEAHLRLALEELFRHEEDE